MKYKVIGRDGNEITSKNALHPGEIIQMEIEARGFRKTDFAEKMNMKLANLSELIHGKRNVSPAIALKLEHNLNIEADFWLRVQAGYDLSKLRNENQINSLETAI
ncbi:MAG: HigA family addiction module antitoxin [Bacteroidota bacterium]|nr:HigA family addiction module antitoxin [Bacteroidota bacterium]